MTIKACRSYGVLAHEKRPFYSLTPASDIYDEITLVIPDELVYGKNAMDEPILLLNGQKYVLSDILTNWGDEPVLRWYDGDDHCLTLQTR